MTAAALDPGRYRGSPPATRTTAALLAGLAVGGVGAGLILALSAGIALPPALQPALVAFDLTPPPPPPPEAERPKDSASSAAKGAPSARNLKNRATPVVAQKPRIPVPSPPVVAATAPAGGDAAQTGASDRLGPGQGAGGLGNGTGGGGSGGSGGGIATGPRQISGRLSVSDFPDGLIRPGEHASVGVRYAVEIDGRVSGCRVERSSGFGQVDAMACRLITQRFRYRPAQDRSGQPVRSIIVETHTWYNRS